MVATTKTSLSRNIEGRKTNRSHTSTDMFQTIIKHAKALENSLQGDKRISFLKDMFSGSIDPHVRYPRDLTDREKKYTLIVYTHALAVSYANAAQTFDKRCDGTGYIRLSGVLNIAMVTVLQTASQNNLDIQAVSSAFMEFFKVARAWQEKAHDAMFRFQRQSM
jgi:hypothetical protein